MKIIKNLKWDKNRVSYLTILTFFVIQLFFAVNIGVSQTGTCQITDPDGNPPGEMSCGAGMGFCLEPSKNWCFNDKHTYTNTPEVQPDIGYPSGECAVAYLIYWGTKIPHNKPQEEVLQHAIWILQGEDASQYESEAQMFADMANDVCANGASVNITSIDYVSCEVDQPTWFGTDMNFTMTIETNGFFYFDGLYQGASLNLDYNDPSYTVIDNHWIYPNTAGMQTLVLNVTYSFSYNDYCNTTLRQDPISVYYTDQSSLSVEEWYDDDPNDPDAPGCQTLGQYLGGSALSSQGTFDYYDRNGSLTPVCNNNEFYVEFCASGDPNYTYTVTFAGSNSGSTYTFDNLTHGVTETIGPFSESTIDWVSYQSSAGTSYCGPYLDADSWNSPCAASGCSIDAGLTNVQCNNAGTESDGSDDYISFSLNPTGTSLGSGYTVSVDNGGVVTPTAGVYGSATNFQLQSGSSDGTIYTITVTDNDDSSCSTTATVQKYSCSFPCPPADCLYGTMIKN